MPSDAELRTYSVKLPPIYRDVLSAFPSIEPARKVGYGLAYQSLVMHFANQHLTYSYGEVERACEQLAAAGFLEIKHGFFAHPTPLGERLISMLTGRSAPAIEVPALPEVPW
jgi:hypothetical protein